MDVNVEISQKFKGQKGCAIQFFSKIVLFSPHLRLERRTSQRRRDTGENCFLTLWEVHHARNWPQTKHQVEAMGSMIDGFGKEHQKICKSACHKSDVPNMILGGQVRLTFMYLNWVAFLKRTAADKLYDLNKNPVNPVYLLLKVY